MTFYTPFQNILSVPLKICFLQPEACILDFYWEMKLRYAPVNQNGSG